MTEVALVVAIFGGVVLRASFGTVRPVIPVIPFIIKGRCWYLWGYALCGLWVYSP